MAEHTTDDVYEAPTLTVLGTLAELTKGNSGTVSVDITLGASITP